MVAPEFPQATVAVPRRGLYCYGYDANRIILDLAPVLLDVYAAGACLITNLDSSRPVAGLAKFLVKLRAAAGSQDEVRIVQEAALVTGRALRWVFAGGETFFGFDEIYLFDKPPADLVTPTDSYTSEGWQFDQGLPEELIRYLAESGASVLLADGLGLNYIFREDLMERLGRLPVGPEN